MKRLLYVVFSCVIIGSLTACTAVMPPTEVPATPTLTPVPIPSDGSPPPASLEIDGATQTAGVGTYCWTTDTSGMCVDKIGLPTPREALTATSPVHARLTLPLAEAPVQVALSVFPATESNEVQVNGGGEEFQYWMPAEGLNRDLALQTSQDITLELDPGLYVFYIFAVWEGKGDVSYGFLVEVK